MKSRVERIDDFKGITKDIAPAKLPNPLFQEDKGGDRTHRGSWKRRRGLAHTTIPKVAAAVTCLSGFSIPGISKGYMVCEGTNIHGFVDVEQQPDVLSHPDAGRLFFTLREQSGSALLVPGI